MHVNSCKSLVKRKHAEYDHEYSAYERARRPVDMNSRNLSDADEEVRNNEDDKSGDHKKHFTTDAPQNSSLCWMYPTCLL